MNRFATLRNQTRAAIFDGDGVTSTEVRRRLGTGDAPADLAALVAKIRTTAYRISDEELAELKKTYSEDQLFEIILATVYGTALEQLDAAHKALEQA